METFDAALYLDIYGALLTDKQAEILGSYYNEDYSLSEIAKGLNISRQAAHDAIRIGTLALREYEGKLGLVRAHREALREAEEAGEALRDLRAAIAEVQNIALGGNAVAGGNAAAGGNAVAAGRLDAAADRIEKLINKEV